MNPISNESISNDPIPVKEEVIESIQEEQQPLPAPLIPSVKAKEVAQAEILAAAKLEKASESYRIPGVDGIAIFLDPTLSEKINDEQESGSLTNEVVCALKDNLPIIASSHIIKQGIIKIKQQTTGESTDLLSMYDIYQTKEGSYSVLIPKIKNSSIPLKSLKLNPSLKKIDINKTPDTVFDVEKETPYKELLEVFQKQDFQTSKLQLSLYIIGHGSIEKRITANLPDEQYRHFIKFLNNQYSLSCCAIASCEPHGEEEEIDGILIRKGTPNINSLSNISDIDFRGFFSEISQITLGEFHSKQRKKLTEALQFIFKEHSAKQPIVRLPLAIRTGKAYPSKSRMILSVGDMVKPQLEKHFTRITGMTKPELQEVQQQLRKLENEIAELDSIKAKKLDDITKRDKKIKEHQTLLKQTFKEIRPSPLLVNGEIEELHLLAPHISKPIEIKGKAPILLSHQGAKGCHLFESISAPNVNSLNEFIESCFSALKLKELELRPSGNFLYLFKEITLKNEICKNVYVRLSSNEVPNCSFVEREAIPKEAHLSELPNNITKVDPARFQGKVLEHLQECTPSEKTLRETTGGQVSSKDLLKEVQSLFFPNIPWVNDLSSGRKVFQSFLGMIMSKDPINPVYKKAIVDHLVHYNLLEKSISFDVQIDPEKTTKDVISFKIPIPYLSSLVLKKEQMALLKQDGLLESKLSLLGKGDLKFKVFYANNRFSIKFDSPFPTLIQYLDPSIIPKWETKELFWKALELNDVRKLKLYLSTNPTSPYLKTSNDKGENPLEYSVRKDEPNSEIVKLLIDHGCSTFTSEATSSGFSLKSIIKGHNGFIPPELNKSLQLLASIDDGTKIDKDAWIEAAKTGVDLKVLSPFIRKLKAQQEKSKLFKDYISEERMLAALEYPNANLLKMIKNSGLIPASRFYESYLDKCLELGSIEKFKILIDSEAIDPQKAFEKSLSKPNPEFIAYLISLNHVPRNLNSENLLQLAFSRDCLNLFQILEAKKMIKMDDNEIQEYICTSVENFNPTILPYLLKNWKLMVVKNPDLKESQDLFYTSALNNPTSIAILLHNQIEPSSKTMISLVKSIFSLKEGNPIYFREVICQALSKKTFAFTPEEIEELFKVSRLYDSKLLFVTISSKYKNPIPTHLDEIISYYKKEIFSAISNRSTYLLDFLLNNYIESVGVYFEDHKDAEKIIQLNVEIYKEALKRPIPEIISLICSHKLITNPSIAEKILYLLLSTSDKLQKVNMFGFIIAHIPARGIEYFEGVLNDPAFLDSLLDVGNLEKKNLAEKNGYLLVNFLVLINEVGVTLSPSILNKIDAFIKNNEAKLQSHATGKFVMTKWKELNFIPK